MKIARAPLEAEVHASAFDPVVTKVALAGFEALECANLIPTCLSGAHCCVVVPSGNGSSPHAPELIEHMVQPVAGDARRIFDSQQFR